MKLKRILSNNLLMLKYIFKHVPLYGFLTVFASILAAGANMINPISLKFIIDAVNSGSSFLHVSAIIGIAFAISAIWGIFCALKEEILDPVAAEKLNRAMQTELFKKAVGTDLACYDNPQFYTDFVWATSEADKRAIEVIISVRLFLASFFTVVGFATAILIIDPSFFIFVAASVMVSFIAQIMRNKKQFAYDMELKPQQRKRDYMSRVFYLSDYAKELRLTDIGGKLIESFKSAIADIKDTIRKHGVFLGFLFWVERFVINDLIIDFLAGTLAVYKAMILKSISIGDITALMSSMFLIKWHIGRFVDMLTQFQKHSLYVDNFRNFIEYENKIIDGRNKLKVPEKPSALELKNISFSYDGQQSKVINNISMKIKPGEKIALVGHNGAGKSTLIKLILRLYDVTEGAILLDGVDIKEYELNSYRNMFGTVFQDFQIFAATVGENVLFSKTDDPEKRRRAEKALSLSGFGAKLELLNDGLDTMLTAEFDEKGVILSGGEAQKIAVARMFAKDCSVAVLDEPSSALDPIAEYNLNNSMMDAARDKTLVLISHRLSTTRMADRIFLLEHGSIIEQGTHEELIMYNGRYAEMFNMQAEKYMD